MTAWVRVAIDAIPQGAWTPIPYWTADVADVAEIGYIRDATALRPSDAGGSAAPMVPTLMTPVATAVGAFRNPSGACTALSSCLDGPTPAAGLVANGLQN